MDTCQQWGLGHPVCERTLQVSHYRLTKEEGLDIPLCALDERYVQLTIESEALAAASVAQMNGRQINSFVEEKEAAKRDFFLKVGKR